MKKKILGLAAALSCSCAVTFANVQTGVYQQDYPDGRLKSVVTILEKDGVGDYMAQYSMGDSPYVCMIALNNDGKEIEQYAARISEGGGCFVASENNFVINEANLAKCNNNEMFQIEENKKLSPIISFKGGDKLEVTGAGSKYDGVYHFSPRSRVQANEALMLHAYMTTRIASFYDTVTKPRSYRICSDREAPWINQIFMDYIDKNKEEYEKVVVMDNEFNIVMEGGENGEKCFKPFFVSKEYPQWAVQGLASERSKIGGYGLYMHRFLYKHYPELTRNNESYLVRTDFFGGEFEGAINTSKYDIWLKDGDGRLKAGICSHSDNGEMRAMVYKGLRAVTGDEVRIRNLPNTDGKILGYVNRGDKVDVLGIVPDNYDSPNQDWLAIRYGNNKAYIAAQFVALPREWYIFND